MMKEHSATCGGFGECKEAMSSARGKTQQQLHEWRDNNNGNNNRTGEMFFGH